MDFGAFLRAHARVTTSPLVPEVRLWLADEITPLWEATEEWLAERGIEPPFWAFAWPGSQALARWVLDHPQEVRGRVVLDFASGCGLARIAAAMAGAARVIVVDVDPRAIEVGAVNAALNGARIEPVVGDPTGAPLARDVEVLLAGDVCYESRPSVAILAWLRASAASGVRVLLGDPGRAFAPTEGVIELAAWEVPTTVEVEGVVSRRARVMRLERRGARE